MEIVPFRGWQRNARLTCGNTEMIVTLEVGPRVISYGPIGSENMMAVHEATAGKSGGDEFHSYGGHRLWIAPEEDPRTFQPDNGPVAYEMDADWHVFTTETDKFHIQKQWRIRPDPSRNAFEMVYRLHNQGAYPVELAAWTPTQFATGGECIFPQADFIAHADKVLPARPLVLWHYTNMSDPRWTWGEKVVRLKWMDKPPTKCGMLIEQGYVAYHLNGNTHLRRFPCEPDKQYPDYGCNFETFTRQDMLEVETLGQLDTIAKGAFAEHRETWYLIPDEVPPTEDAACASWLKGLASPRPL
ncbi:MAG TPA: hypothetical protein VK934_09470 [Fimbriimonas sp.]|nr:hypothetical protein [Fimbriimonas sp.]